MGTVGSLVSIPVFCDSGYVIMNPLARSIARVKRGGYVTLALALGCGMTLTHHMVPPTPGPLAATGILGADIGSLILTGVIFTVLLLPVVVICARWIGPKLEPVLNATVKDDVYGSVTTTSADGHATWRSPRRRQRQCRSRLSCHRDRWQCGHRELRRQRGHRQQRNRCDEESGSLPRVPPLIVPLLLIVANTVSTAIDKSAQGELSGDAYEPSSWVAPLAFLGNPVIALMIGLVLAVYTLLPRVTPRNKVQLGSQTAQPRPDSYLLITGAGGAFGKVLTESGVGDALAEAIASISLPAFLVPFLIATLVRIAQGSGTVAMITAASVTAPLIAPLGLSPLVGQSWPAPPDRWSSPTSTTRTSGLSPVSPASTASVPSRAGRASPPQCGPVSIPLLFVLDLIV